MLRILGLVTLLVSSSVPAQGPPALAKRATPQSIAGAFAAKSLCSALFVSGRSEASVMATELAPERLTERLLLKLLDVKIDRDTKTVTVTGPGVRARAIWRPGVGATLLSGVDEAEVRSRVRAAPSGTHFDPNRPWPVGDARTHPAPDDGIDHEKVQSALDLAFAEDDPLVPKRTLAVVVVHRGRLIAERYAEGIHSDTALCGWSMTKSVLAALVGLRADERKLDLDHTPVLAEWATPSDPRGKITFDDLLRMRSGLEFVERYQDPLEDPIVMLYHEPDMGAFAAAKSLEVPRNTRWQYSSGTSNIVSLALRRSFESHEDYVAWPRKVLFDRIGMSTAVFEEDAAGTLVASSSFFASARDWARLGQLYLQRGRWRNERVLSETWIDYCLRQTPGVPRGRYGAHWWINRGVPTDPGDRHFPALPRDTFMALGYQDQRLMVIPSRDLVFVRLGLTKKRGAWPTQSVLRMLLSALP